VQKEGKREVEGGGKEKGVQRNSKVHSRNNNHLKKKQQGEREEEGREKEDNLQVTDISR